MGPVGTQVLAGPADPAAETGLADVAAATTGMAATNDAAMRRVRAPRLDAVLIGRAGVIGRAGCMVGSVQAAVCRFQPDRLRRSMSGRPPAWTRVMPTAVQAMGAVHETPDSEPRTNAVEAVIQVDPFHIPISGSPPTSDLWPPTATQALELAQLTPANEAPLPGLGVYSMAHAVAFQPRPKVDSDRSPVLSSPTV
jgi:hypothetical protein